MARDRDLRLVSAPAPRAIEDRTDEDLMVAAAAGSRDAFGVLVSRYLGRLTGFCAKLVADARVAEELAQDVLLAVWRVRRDYRPEKPFRVFLFTIASNRCRNHARSWRRGLRWFGRRGDAEALDELPALDAGQLDRVLTRERQRRVRVALAALPARAFVDIATSEIRNAAYRPKVFARGPGGDDRTALFQPTTAGQELTLDAGRPARITVRDRDDLAWIDVYKEAGAALTLRLPPTLSPAIVDELAVHHGEVTRIRRRALPEPGTARVALADLSTVPQSLSARGPDQLFRKLFTAPFGPAALARYDAERARAPTPTFGVSHDDAVRMAHLLAQIDDAQREFRLLSAALIAAVGAAGIAGAALTPSYVGNTSNNGAFDGIHTERSRWLVAAGGVLLVGLGVHQALRDPESEHLHAALTRGLARHDDPGLLVASIDRRLHAAATAATRTRWIQGGIGGLLIAGSVAAYAYDARSNESIRQFRRPVVTAMAALGTMTLLTSFLESPIERTARLWDDDPGIGVPRLAIVPVSGGATVSLSRGF